MSLAISVDEQAPARRELPPSMVERMTLILDAFDRPHARLTLEDVAHRTHLPRSTAHRILDQLVRLDWLEHTSFGYVLGSRSLGLGGGQNNHAPIREAAATRLQELHLRTGMVAHLGILEGSDVYYLDKVGGRLALSVPSRVGGRMPAHQTALGKAMLAWLEPEQVERLAGVAACRDEDRVGGMLHQELARVRSRGGLAFERGEAYPGIACVAAAVRGPQGPVAAVSLVGGMQTPMNRIAPLVADAARRISRELWPNLRIAPRSRRLGVVGQD